MAPIGGFLELVFELIYEINGSKGKGQKEKSSLLNGNDQCQMILMQSATWTVTPRLECAGLANLAIVEPILIQEVLL